MRCGNCKGNHEKVAEVRDCYAQTEWEAEQAKAEAEAERRNERWFEERGGAVDDPRERELQMMDDLRRETLDIQAKERAEDELAYASKMARDEEAMAASKLDTMTGAPGRDMASEKQIKYAMDLLASKEWPDVITRADLENMERRQVSKLINNLKDAPRKQGPVEEELAVGMYWINQTHDIIRVYLGQRSGRNLAAKLVETGQETVDGKKLAKYEFDYVGSAESLVKGRTDLGRVELVRMSREEAVKWGQLTRSCVACGRRLDVPESVDRGMGPVCFRKEYW